MGLFLFHYVQFAFVDTQISLTSQLNCSYSTPRGLAKW